MNGDLDVGGHKIKNVKTPLAREADNAAKVDFVIETLNDSNEKITQHYRDWVAQSHLISSHNPCENFSEILARFWPPRFSSRRDLG